ncbi:hypothetical protein [Salinivibrio costicola]|uniref:AbiV family abortive infection protein n=1 Tax=Salinivibrio costicola subsp. alcaliphilus TaxID=272773 RepID=A0ABX3KP31_SALCS|nr:hypothetical protein [Salinivibrio costicola]OOF32802.1 hypothetical protein BZJ21_14265 [Salinivibrio costicola subsp. alcaliphilus]
MERIESKSLEEAIIKLRSTESQIMDLGKAVFSADNGNMFHVDLLAIAAMKRTSGNTEGFITLIEAKNMAAARSLLRIQIDTFLRFSATWLAEKPHDFAKDVIGGKQIRNLKDRNGKKMNDGYLVEVLSPEYPWLKDVYKNLCGYIHFSGSHLSNAVQSLNDNDRTVTFHIGKEDIQYPECSWTEAVDCFTNAINILFYYIDGWIQTKSGVDTANNQIHPTPKNGAAD